MCRLALLALLPAVSQLAAQTPAGMHPPGAEGSANITVLSHIPLGRIFTVGDIEIEQELSRPYAYVPRLHGTTASAGFNIISLKDPENARMIYYWRIENPELHQGTGCLQNKYFKLKNRYYTAQSCQFRSTGPDGDLGAVVFDVTRREEPKLITSLTGIAGVTWGHTFTPTPDGRYAVTEAEYQYAPLRIFDMKPGLDGSAKTISRPIGAWTARWEGCPHNM